MRTGSIIVSVLIMVLWGSFAHSAPLDSNAKRIGGDHSESDKPASTDSKVGNKQKKPANDIFQFDNPEHQAMLNKPTLPIKKLPDPEIDKLIESMLSKMRLHGGGVGISANQVGHSLQISITTDPFDLKHPGNYKVYINPVITIASEKVFCFWHGCLSLLDGKFGKVATWREITVSALDQQGKSFTEELKETNAVIFQHEFRHLLGGGYMSHASSSRTEAEMLQAMLREMKEKKFSYLELCKDGEKPLLEDYRVGETIDAYSKRMLKTLSEKKQDKNNNPGVKKEPQKPQNKKE